MRLDPRRLFCNVAGDFYATGENPKPGESRSRWMGDCLTCHGPESQAQELLAELNNENRTTYFVRQPETEIETERACRAVQYCCVDALRYAGQNAAIIHRLGNNPAHCDYLIAKDGRMVYCLDEQGELLPWAAGIRTAIGMGIDIPSVPTEWNYNNHGMHTKHLIAPDRRHRPALSHPLVLGDDRRSSSPGPKT